MLARLSGGNALEFHRSSVRDLVGLGGEGAMVGLGGTCRQLCCEALI